MPTDIARFIEDAWDGHAWSPSRGQISRLGTARWMAPQEATASLRFLRDPPSSHIWIGETLDKRAEARTLLGYCDDRHVALVSGTRGGKGTSIIIPNLCFWPGSCVVIDPKGENATVTAQRRGGGSDYADGMGQAVFVLDPFGEVQIPHQQARYNPLGALDPDSEFSIDDASRIASALVLPTGTTEPFWEEWARSLIKGLILFVLTEAPFADQRNLISVWRLVTQGATIHQASLRDAGYAAAEIPGAFELLWDLMAKNESFDGTVAGVGLEMQAMAKETCSSILKFTASNLEFIGSPPMQRLLETSDFSMERLKTDPGGVTIYLVLPQRYMPTHFRWLRLMIALAVGEMERIKGVPATKHPTLLLLDEFAGLKRMEVIEHAVAQAAGFGLKFFFVIQNLSQLKAVYGDSWETFLSNAGLKLFFQIDDNFSRDYVSNQLGSTEARPETSTSQWSHSRSDSESKGTTTGTSWGSSTTLSSSTTNQNTEGVNETVHKRALLNPEEIGLFLARVAEPDDPRYPGLLLALIPGRFPLLARRADYFLSHTFDGLYDPHPDHSDNRPPTLAKLQQQRNLEQMNAGRTPVTWSNQTPHVAAVTTPPNRRRLFDTFMPIVVVAAVAGLLYGLKSASISRGTVDPKHAQELSRHAPNSQPSKPRMHQPGLLIRPE